MEEQIIEYIVMIAPSAAAIITAIITVVKILRSFNDLRADVRDKTKMQNLEEALADALYEVNELKKLLRKELEAKTRVKQDVDDQRKN